MRSRANLLQRNGITPTHSIVPNEADEGWDLVATTMTCEQLSSLVVSFPFLQRADLNGVLETVLHTGGGHHRAERLPGEEDSQFVIQRTAFGCEAVGDRFCHDGGWECRRISVNKNDGSGGGSGVIGYAIAVARVLFDAELIRRYSRATVVWDNSRDSDNLSLISIHTTIYMLVLYTNTESPLDKI